MDSLQALSWQHTSNAQSFVADMNSRMPLGFEVEDVTPEANRQYRPNGGTFEAKAIDNPYFQRGFSSPTDEFRQLVIEVGKLHFNTEPGFNNSGSTFWFIS